MAKGVVKSKPENFVSTYILFWNQILPNSIKAVEMRNRSLTDFVGIMAQSRGAIEHAKIRKHIAD